MEFRVVLTKARALGTEGCEGNRERGASQRGGREEGLGLKSAKRRMACDVYGYDVS